MARSQARTTRHSLQLFPDAVQICCYAFGPQPAVGCQTLIAEVDAPPSVLPVVSHQLIGVGPLQGDPLSPKRLLGFANRRTRRVARIVIGGLRDEPGKVPSGLP